MIADKRFDDSRKDILIYTKGPRWPFNFGRKGENMIKDIILVNFLDKEVNYE